jgi:hypothetical protein
VRNIPFSIRLFAALLIVATFLALGMPSGPISSGMSRDEVEKALGQPHVEANPLCYRCPLIYYVTAPGWLGNRSKVYVSWEIGSSGKPTDKVADWTCYPYDHVQPPWLDWVMKLLTP